MRTLGKIGITFITAFTFAGCNVKTNAGGESVRTRLDALTGTADCPAGLLQVSSGVDADGSGTLEDTEIDTSNTFCLTAIGGVDAPGSMVRLEVEPPGVHCAGGGQKILIGNDDGSGGATAGDGELEGDEVHDASYVCNGFMSVADGQLVVIDVEEPGDECAEGGSRITSGRDDGAGGGVAGDGELHADEVDSTTFACNGATGTRGYSALTKTTAEPEGPACAAGGQKMENGVDDGDGNGTAGDGKLSSGEVDSRAYVCNGTRGAKGEKGAAGSTPLVSLVAEAAGVNCATGGTRIDVGYDDGDGGETAGDGVLGAGEVSSSSYVCNGAAGSSPAPLTALTLPEDPGESCAAGGYQLQLGYDDGRGTGTANDGQLDDLELTSARFLCHGVDGLASLVSLADIDPGPTCATGGQWVRVGLDDGGDGSTARDGILSASEVDREFAVCNGRSGIDTLVETTDAGVAECPAGGMHVAIGRDDGTGGGVAENGSLEAGEILEERDLCNGTQGAAGTSVLMTRAAVGMGEQGCAAGGTMLSWGLDDGNGTGTAGDAMLSLDEVDDSVTVCNGDAGAAPFDLLTSTTPADVGDCPHGGTHLAFGLDDGDGGGTARNGTLEIGEVDRETNVCNGATGAQGNAGSDGYSALVDGLTLNAGEGGCAAGGTRVEWGIDDGQGGHTARDGILDVGEIDGQQTVCNGETGAQGETGVATLVQTFDLDPGGTCPNGGVRLDFGGDDGVPGGIADNGTLEPEEFDDTKIVCNGVNGSDGTNGTNGAPGAAGANGYNSLVTLDSDVGASCTSSGTVVRSGLDDGDGGGIAGDGTLQAGEVDSTSYVCDGASGSSGVGMGTIRDANGAFVGTLIDFGDYGVTGFSSTGYLFYLSWQAEFFESQIYSSQPACGAGGTLWLNAGTSSPQETLAKSLVWFSPNDTLYAPANGNANGVATSVAFTAASLWNYGSCGGGSSNGGWVLEPVTRASAGLPDAIVAPLTLE